MEKTQKKQIKRKKKQNKTKLQQNKQQIKHQIPKKTNKQIK